MQGASAGDPLTVNQVREGFRTVTGDELRLQPFPAELEGVIPHVDYLSTSTIETGADGEAEFVPASDSLHGKYGNFVISVYKTSVPSERTTIPADEHGIRWLTLMAEVGPRPGEYLAAEKVYGANILLAWYPERSETNSQWERLDAALTGLVRRPPR